MPIVYIANCTLYHINLLKSLKDIYNIWVIPESDSVDCFIS